MRILSIEKFRTSDRFVLEAGERFWIYKYKSVKVQVCNTINMA